MRNPFLWASLSIQKSREGHLPASQQILEMAYLFLFRGLPPSYYHAAGFWRKEIPWGDKKDHLSCREFTRRLDALNPLEYRKISQHKVVEKSLLTLLRLPTATFLGHLQAEVGRTCEGSPLRNAENLERFLKERTETTICFKEIEGWGGRSFRAVEVVKEDAARLTLRPLLSRITFDTGEFCAKHLQLASGRGWIVEAYLEQHPVLKALNPTSLNTIRIWIIRRPGRMPDILGAIQRIGRANSLVDNVSSGGFGVPIDLEQGVLLAAVQMKPTRTTFARHPDHQAQIEGVRLPFWEEAKKLAANALLAFPEMRFSGLDIGLTPGGPVIVELNPEPDWIGQARLCLPSARYIPAKQKELHQDVQDGVS
jgi:hypothetical protein